MQFLNPTIKNIQRDRDFGVVEAWVGFDLKVHPNLPARHITVLARTEAQAKNLRQRLLANARIVAGIVYKSNDPMKHYVLDDRVAA